MNHKVLVTLSSSARGLFKNGQPNSTWMGVPLVHAVLSSLEEVEDTNESINQYIKVTAETQIFTSAEDFVAPCFFKI